MKYFISSLGFWSKNVTSILNKNILLLKKTNANRNVHREIVFLPFSSWIDGYTDVQMILIVFSSTKPFPRKTSVLTNVLYYG